MRAYVEIRDDRWIPVDTIVEVRAAANGDTFTVATHDREYVLKGRAQDFIMKVKGSFV